MAASSLEAMLRGLLWWLFLPLPSAASVAELRLGYLYIQSPSSWCQESFSQFKLAVQEVNADPTLLPNHTLTYLLADTEGSEMRALEGAVSLLSGSRPVHAIVGTGYSSALEAPALHCSMVRKPIVSPGSTAIVLSDKQRYPYLLRTVSNDAGFLKAMAVLVYEMGWRKVASLTKTDFEQGAIQVLHPSLKALGVEYLSLAYGDITTTRGEQDLNSTLSLITRAGFRVVVFYGVTVDMARLDELSTAKGLRTEDYSWVLMKGAFVPPWTTAMHVFVVTDYSVAGATNPVRADFMARWPTVSTVYNETAHGAWDPVTKTPFYGNNTYTTVVWDTDYAPIGNGEPDVWGMIVYDTVWVLAKAMHAVLQSGGDPADGVLLRQKLLAVEHLGITGKMVFDQGTQDMLVQLEVVMTNGTSPHVAVGQTTPSFGTGTPGDGTWCLGGCLSATPAQLAALPWMNGRAASDGRALDASKSDALVADTLMEGARIEIQFNARDSFGRPPCFDTCKAVGNASLCLVCRRDLAAYDLLALEARDLAGQVVAPLQPIPPIVVQESTGRGTIVVPLGFAGAGLQDRQLDLVVRHRGRVVPLSSQGSKQVTFTSPACPAGMAGPPGRCVQCIPGRVAPRRGMGNCSFCGPGAFQDSAGEASCKSCSLGRFSATQGLSECNACPFGSYLNGTGGSACWKCPSPMTTLLPGSESIFSCVCPAGFYRPLGTVVREGQATGPCETCPDGMACPVGSDARNFPGGPAGAASIEAPKVMPNFWSSSVDPLYIFRCQHGDKQCPGGPPEACGQQMVGRTCSICENGYYRQGDTCLSCPSEVVSKVLFPTLPTVFSILIILPFYKVSAGRQDELAWNSGTKSVPNILTMALYTMQVAGILVTCNLENKPKSTGSAWPWVNDVLGLLQMQCAGVGNFSLKLGLKLILPAWCAFCFIFIGALSIPLRKLNGHFHLDFDVLWGCFGGAFMVFYISTCALSFSLFKCYEHPNGELSVQSSAEVLCYRDEWTQMVALGMSAVLIYCGGSFVLFVWILWKAPAHRDDIAFNKRWKFLLSRFRPACRWWTIPWLLKGLALNLAQVVTTKGQDQLLLLQATIVTYSVVANAHRPWRHVDVNVIDCAVHLCLAVACGMLYWYAEPIGGNSGREYLVHILVSLPVLLVAVFISLLVFSKAWIFYKDNRITMQHGSPQHITDKVCVVGSGKQVRKSVVQARFAAFAELSHEESKSILDRMTEQDRRMLLKANELLEQVTAFNVRKTQAGVGTFGFTSQVLRELEYEEDEEDEKAEEDEEDEEDGKVSNAAPSKPSQHAGIEPSHSLTRQGTPHPKAFQAKVVT